MASCAIAVCIAVTSCESIPPSCAVNSGVRVLIENDKITKIAKDIDAADAEVIDCTGLTVAPGFIDAHSHNDFFYDYDDAERFYEPFIRQGITTQITGNCGFSPFGVDKNTKYKDKVGGGLFHAKNPGSFKDFVKNAEGKLYVNIVPLIGHGTTRISISGFDAKPLTKEQIDEEMKLVDEAMENGAFGGSFGFMYEPGMYSKTDELVAFAKELHPIAFDAAIVGIKVVISATLNDIGSITSVSTFPLNIPYCIFASLSLKKFFKPLTTVIESMLLFSDPNTDIKDIGIDTVSISFIVLNILLCL